MALGARLGMTMFCPTICATSRLISRGSARMWCRAGSRACKTCAAIFASSPAPSPPSPRRLAADGISCYTAVAIAPRSSRRSSIDIWPGFVDALAQLLMVIIFILLVFTAGQFYLSEALSGRDQALQKLQARVNELGDLLAMERRSNADLSAQLTSSLAERDQLAGK